MQVLQEFIADPIEEFIFKPLINERFGEKVENAEIVWKPILEESKDMRSQRLIQMLQAGAITVNELRKEAGFNMIAEPKYDKLEKSEPSTKNTGFPPKEQPGEAPTKPGESLPTQKEPNTEGIPENKRVTQQSKTPPESHMKLEEIKGKKINLMQIDEDFREKLLGLTKQAKFELANDAKLVKEVKNETLGAANKVINEHVVSSYLLSKLEVNAGDKLILEQEDLGKLSKMKEECSQNFEKIIDDMIIAKQKGRLE
jgi:hypothetical protein